MNQYSYTSNSDISYIDNLYSQYKSDPLSVDVTWQKFFEGFEFADENSLDSIKFTESSVSKLIQSYRKYGHLNSLTNPVRTRRDHNVRFNIEEFGLSDNDLSQTFSSGSEIGLEGKSLKDIGFMDVHNLGGFSDWQSEGQGFKSPYLHHLSPRLGAGFLVFARGIRHGFA